jgi:hypothetical protein
MDANQERMRRALQIIAKDLGAVAGQFASLRHQEAGRLADIARAAATGEAHAVLDAAADVD